MSLNIKEDFSNLTIKVGKWAFVFVLFVVVTIHFRIFQLGDFLSSISIWKFSLVDFGYLYLALNGIGACPFIYLERKSKQREGDICPRCKSTLEYTGHTCPQCGDIEFKKK